MTLPTTLRILLLALATVGNPVAAAELQHHGHFKRMMHTGDTVGQVALAELPAGRGHWGVGALAGLRGELVMLDGRLLVSRGADPSGRVSEARSGEQAVLWAGAPVEAWQDQRLEAPLDLAQMEVVLRERVRAQGRDPALPFVFLIEGRMAALRWHVVTGEASTHVKHSGHANTKSGMHVFDEPGTQDLLVGIYSGSALEGVVSHPGERLHLHFVSDDRTRSGHVDALQLVAGAVLRLPKP
ncbi:MAG: acetolactate decarboxylase [Burkholderiaceae bacterium]|nr:acetolactate decarboxylase [Burkholderiaceae bacterium]